MRPAFLFVRFILCLVLPLSLAATRAGAAADTVEFRAGGYPAGTIVVRTSERRLYLVLPDGLALRFTVGVGKAGKQWQGSAQIVAKFLQPAWMPPAEVKHDKPNIPNYIAGGSPANPMGAAAMVLTGGEYAIHGTNRPDSIGGFVSYGCIRMFNQDILTLYQRVSIGTSVVVMR
jgi:lipoprotein-anchoring transpeptidase ErfK/SrfK